MRVYYIFLINRETYMLTKNKPDNLYIRKYIFT